MRPVPVKHPEVDEILWVHPLVTCVPCPLCKVEPGVPCKGSRFHWLAAGRRIGFRYTQDTHYPRRDLWQAYKQSGFDKIPEISMVVFDRHYGPFPKKFVPPKTAAPKSPWLGQVVRTRAALSCREPVQIGEHGQVFEQTRGKLGVLLSNGRSVRGPIYAFELVDTGH